MLPIIPIVAAGSFVSGMIFQAVGTMLHRRHQQTQARRAAEEALRQTYDGMSQQERDFAAEILRQMADQASSNAQAQAARSAADSVQGMMQ